MSSITKRIEKFIADHEIEVSADDLEKLVKGCIRDLFEHVKDVPTLTTVKEKSEKLDDPRDAKEREDLRNCTKEILNAFCKENGLRVGGTKKEVGDRVWRFVSDESTDDDISPRSEKKKAAKAVPVKHDCCGTTAKGTACMIIAEEDKIGGKWYCWRHAKAAISEAKKKKVSSSDDEESEDDE
jgi:hypothetical protein